MTFSEYQQKTRLLYVLTLYSSLGRVNAVLEHAQISRATYNNITSGVRVKNSDELKHRLIQELQEFSHGI